MTADAQLPDSTPDTIQASANADQDLFLFDTDRMQELADATALREGLAGFKQHCVTELGCGAHQLSADVEDSERQVVFHTELRYDDKGELSASCNCGAAGPPLCRHAVAALYAYSSERGGQDELMGAMDSAIGERTQRGRTEVQVKHLDGDPWFGAWSASSVTSSTHFPQTYRVHIRSLHRRVNFCTCPDFANNQLGTCKHIEAVLHKVGKRGDYDQLKEQPVPRPFVYLAWDLEDAPQIRLHRGDAVPEDLQRILDEYFDAAGGFRGRLPDDVFRFVDRIGDRSDIDVGEDALAHARHLAAVVARRARTGELRARMEAAGGHLPGIQARLYPYQVEGTAFLAGNGRALLADDMGLGKTLQAIAAATWLMEKEEAERVLIVCPASLKQQWAREIQKFTGREAQVVQGPPPARGVQYRQGSGFFIINYELVLRDLSVINRVLSPDLLVLDEAQRIKNWRTKIASAIKLVPSRYAFVLTGTPLENRLEDLYSLMQMVDPKVLGPLWRYMVDFHVTDERGKVLGYRNLSELRRRLVPVMLRRDRRLVRDQLPERIEQRLDVAMTDAQRELHDAALSAAGGLAHIAKRRPLTPTEQHRLMAALQQARMACNAAGLVDKVTEGSPKLDELEQIMEELCQQSGLKAVVFSQWEQMTRMVEQRLKRLGLGYVRLHGGVPTARRGGLMDRFREDDAVQVFVSTDAGGVGLNLQSASVLVNLDMPWNPAVLDQRIARVHRLGQTEKVQVILMLAADSYEERVLGLVQGKRNLFDNVVGQDASEDVVGVSRKLLETLVEDLAEKPETVAAGEEQAAEAEPGEAARHDLGEAAARPSAAGDAEEIRVCIEAIQQAFGLGVERIMGSGGGMLVVIDRVDEAAERQAQQLSSDEIPVAVVDPLTLSSLRRLGAASPLGETRTYFDAAEEGEKGEEGRLSRLAREKLKAAEILLGQQCPGPATELLLSAVLAAAAARAGVKQPPSPREAGVWLYGEAVPKGLLTQDQAALVMRGVSLAQAPSVPEALLQDLFREARTFAGNGEYGHR